MLTSVVEPDHLAVVWIQNYFFSDPDPNFPGISDPAPDLTLFLTKEAKAKFKTKLKHKF